MNRILILLTLLTLVSCRKEPTSWDTNLRAPLLKTTLGIEDLIADSLLSYDENGLVSIVYEENIFEFGIDSLIEIEPDTVTSIFTIFPVIQIDLEPGQEFYNESDKFEFDQVEASLRSALLKNGNLTMQALSDIEGDLLLKISIPKAKRNNEIFEFEDIIPAGSKTNPGVLEISRSLDGYELDLTGEDNSSYNELEIFYSLSVPDYESNVTVFSSNEVVLNITYEDLKLDFARGYLGTEEISFDETSGFQSIKELESSIINLQEAELMLSISNGFGVDVKAQIYNLNVQNSANGQNAQLESDLIGSNINLSRASLTNDIEPVETERVFFIDQDNSNIVSLLELIPDSIRIKGQAELNPLGNNSNFNDFASSLSTFTCTAAINIPLIASLTNLSLSDSSALSWDNEEQITGLTLYLHSKSTFKANANLSLLFKDDNDQEILNLTDFIKDGQVPTIPGAIDENPEISTITFILTETEIELLNSVSYVQTQINFETTNYPDFVEFYSSDEIEILLSADINSRIEVK